MEMEKTKQDVRVSSCKYPHEANMPSLFTEKLLLKLIN